VFGEVFGIQESYTIFMGIIKVSILGNCQIESWRRSLIALFPDVEVISTRSVSNGEEISRLKSPLFEESDFVILIDSLKPEFKRVLNDLSDDYKNKLLGVPSIFFRGFHPDSVYVYTDHGPLRSGLGPRGEWVSSLVWYAFQNKIPEKSILKFLSAEYFSTLGFDSVYQDELILLEQDFESHGFKFESWLRPLVQEGSFMHGMNHPKISAVGLLAAQLMQRFSRTPKLNPMLLGRINIDPLSDVQWPIYEPVADQLGIQAFPYFTMSSEIFSFEEYVELSYRKWKVEELMTADFSIVPANTKLRDFWRSV
jgi:Polysaccharide biosynthesis enzyme WcbI